MKEYMELGPVPCEEDCVTVGNDDYDQLSTIESLQYIKLLMKRFPQFEEFGTRFTSMSFPHDFGWYREVVIKYESDTVGEEFAYFVENNLPERWDSDEELRMEPTEDLCTEGA